MIQQNRELKDNGLCLIVEDEPTVLAATSKMIEYSGFQVASGQNGVEGLEVFRERRAEIQTALIDLMMPVMGGIDLAKQLLEESPELPIILMSGYSDKDVDEALLERSNVRFLRKPFSMRDLIGALTESLS